MVSSKRSRKPTTRSPIELVEFTNPVCEDGYYLESGTGPREAKLRPKSARMSTGSPASEAALFRQFADLQNGKDVVTFANAYGMLGSPAVVHRGVTEPYRALGSDDLAAWLHHAAQARWLVTLLDGFRSNTNVSRHFGVYPNYRGVPELFYFSHPEYRPGPTNNNSWDVRDELMQPEGKPPGYFCSPLNHDSDLVRAYEQGDFRLLARSAFTKCINLKLQRVTGESTPGIGFKLSVEDDSPVLKTVVSTLTDVIWLQLAHAATGSRDYRRCEHCGQWFAGYQRGQQRRSDRKFCSSACKTRAFREKQRTKEEQQP